MQVDLGTQHEFGLRRVVLGKGLSWRQLYDGLGLPIVLEGYHRPEAVLLQAEASDTVRSRFVSEEAVGHGEGSEEDGKAADKGADASQEG